MGDESLEPSDSEIIRACKRGDAEKFRLLYDRYHEKGFRIAYRFLGNREDAMEVLQEAFVKAFQGLRGFRFGSSFGTWFYRIVVNASLDRRRIRAHKVGHLEEELDVSSGEMSLGRPSAEPIEMAERKELAAEIQKAIEDLSEDHRAVFILHVIEGVPYKDMAQILRISEGTVMSRLFYARQNLRQKLKDFVEE